MSDLDEIRKEAKRAYLREYRRKNREKISEYNRNYRKSKKLPVLPKEELESRQRKLCRKREVYDKDVNEEYEKLREVKRRETEKLREIRRQEYEKLREERQLEKERLHKEKLLEKKRLREEKQRERDNADLQLLNDDSVDYTKARKVAKRLYNRKYGRENRDRINERHRQYYWTKKKPQLLQARIDDRRAKLNKALSDRQDVKQQEERAKDSGDMETKQTLAKERDKLNKKISRIRKQLNTLEVEQSMQSAALPTEFDINAPPPDEFLSLPTEYDSLPDEIDLSLFGDL